MIIAIWIIAVCEVVRMAQNALQLMMMRGNNSKYNVACEERVCEKPEEHGQGVFPAAGGGGKESQ